MNRDTHPTPPNGPTPYSAKHILPTLLISICIAIGIMCWLSYNSSKLKDQFRVISDVTRINAQQDKAIASVKEETRQVIGDLPQQQESIRAQLAKLEQAIQPLKAQLQQVEKESLTQQVERDRQLAHVVQLRYLGKRIAAVLGDAKKELGLIRERVQELENGPVGKKIAADTDLLDLFISVRNPHVSLEQLLKWEESVGVRLQTIASIDDMESSELMLGQNVKTELKAIHTEAQECLAKLRHQRRTIQQIVSRAEGTSVSVGAQSLLAAIESTQQRRSFELESLALERADEVRERHVVELANAKLETANRRSQASIQFEEGLQELLNTMSGADQQALNDAATKIQQESEERRRKTLARLEEQRRQSAYEAALPELRKYLTPFISHGNTQPREHHIQYETAAITGPVSLGKLKSHGALENSKRGLFVLHALGAGSSNDRPSGPFPPFYGGSSVQPRQVPFFQKVQQLLREHGDLMVQHGLLAE